MSRTLTDDFDDDLPGGSLDLEKGSQVGSGTTSSYDGGGMNFDDDLDGDGPPALGLELDIAPGARGSSGQHAAPPAPSSASVSRAPAAPQASHAATHGGAPGQGSPVPELSFGAPPAPMSSSRQGGQGGQLGQPAALAPPPPSSSVPSMPGVSSSPNMPVPPPSSGSGGFDSQPRIGGGMSGGSFAPAPLARPSAASVIAKYPTPPEKIWETPMYAFRVAVRQFELRSDLESLRRRRSPDVPLYEAALASYDPKALRLGIAINGAAFVVGTFIFFLPVILRFMRAD